MQEFIETPHSKKVVIIGAGSAGLTAAYELCKVGVESIVLEKDNVVGGLARTVNYNGYHFDIGGHRFFTKVKVVEDMWREVLGEDFLERSRLSRIYYNKKFFYYPLRMSNTLSGLGIWNSFLILLSYLKAQIFPEKPEKTFEQWISNRFGKRLYRIFFKTYTEKVWGMPCSEISAEWAAQRIKGLSLLTALRNALLKEQDSHKGSIIKTLIDTFNYPKFGPGMMWETVTNIVQQKGSELRLGAEVEKIFWSNNKVDALEIKINDQRELVKGTHFISSMPIRELIQKFEPAALEEVFKAATNLNYRDFFTVVLIVNKCDVFMDNWIYIHDPDVKVGRIQNFKNWSPH
ncbi:MAG TPA: FAD-dependent oxidoreductase, partial [Puia sp.]|nr:FAD-dependent oxidoreductase [Puia sp.]